MVTLASVRGDLGSLRRHFGNIGVTLASLWGALGGLSGNPRRYSLSKRAPATYSRFRAGAGRVQGECEESARRVRGGCEYRSKGNLTGAKVPWRRFLTI